MKLRISAGPVTPLCLSSPRGENGYQPLIALRGGRGGYPRIDKHLIQGGPTIPLIPLEASSNVTETGLFLPPLPSGPSYAEIIFSL